jgi:AcrR family transcriptional regulator
MASTTLHKDTAARAGAERRRARRPGVESRGPRAENGHARRVRITRERILAAATDAFQRDGYGAATIEGIAARAGIAPASVYNHFASKAGIAQALAERALAAHDEYVAAAWALEGVSPLERLIAAAGGALAFAREQPTLFQAISLSYLSPLGMFPAGTPAAEAIAARRGLQVQRIVTSLQDAIAAGELREHDAPASARFLIAAWAAVLSMEARPESPDDAAATLTAGIRAMIQGTGTPTVLTRDGRLRARYENAIARHGLLSAGR